MIQKELARSLVLCILTSVFVLAVAAQERANWHIYSVNNLVIRGKWLLSMDNHGGLSLTNIMKDELVVFLPPFLEDHGYFSHGSLDVSEDGQWVTFPSSEYEVILFNVYSRQRVRKFADTLAAGFRINGDLVMVVNGEDSETITVLACPPNDIARCRMLHLKIPELSNCEIVDDGRRLFTNTEAEIALWNTFTGEKVWSFAHNGLAMHGVGPYISSDRRFLFYSTPTSELSESQLHVLRIADLSEVMSGNMKNYSTHKSGFLSEEKALISLFDMSSSWHYSAIAKARQSGTRVEYDWEKPIYTSDFGRVRAMAISNDQERFFVGKEHGEIVVVSLNTEAVICTLGPQPPALNVVVWLSDSEIVSGGDRGNLIRYSLETERITSVSQAHRGRILCIAVDRARGCFYSGGSDGKVCRWNIEDNQKIGEVHANALWIQDICVLDDGKQIATIGGNLLITFWYADTFEPIRTMSAADAIEASVLSSQDNILYLATGASDLDSYDCDTGRMVGSKMLNSNVFLLPAFDESEWHVHDMTLIHLRSKGEQKTLVAATNRGVEFRTLSTGHIIELHEMAGGCWSIADGRKSGLLAIGRIKGGIEFYDVNTSNWLEFVGTNRKPRDLAFSPDGELLAAAFWDGLRIYRVNNGNLVFSKLDEELDQDASR